ncbi:MAG: urease subunit alpha, partial [Pseudonocardia sp.]
MAVKLLRRELGSDLSARGRFESEARFAAELRHPGIARAYDFGEQNGRTFLVMELVAGEPLDGILARDGGLPLEAVLDLLVQAGRALTVAHRAGVVHRDVKPANLMVSPDGVLKITDFGIARRLAAASQTATGMVMGTAHYISPEQAQAAQSKGITTLFGGGTGPTDATNGVTTTPGAWHLHRMIQAAEEMPVNMGFHGKGNGSLPEALIEQIKAGASSLKVHEDWGATPAVIDNALSVADEYDIQISVHTDSLNEAGFVEDTISAIDGRTIHTYHTEGAGGGHAPDIMKAAGYPNVLPSSTNPTRPYTTDTTDNLFWMTVITHHLNPGNPEDVAFAQSRIRAETEAAEDVLHDMGVLSMCSSDSQAMGRIGDTVTSCWRTADKMKKMTGSLEGDPAEHDNGRILRYLAKLTINPALAHGVGHLVGSLEPGKIADIVLWPTNTFAVKPKYVVKGGFVAYALMGDPNASIPTPEPVLLRSMFGAQGAAVGRTSATFLSQAAIDAGVPERLGLDRWVEPVRGCRTVGKAQMVRNSATPEIRVD